MTHARTLVRPTWQLQLIAITFAALGALFVFMMDQPERQLVGANADVAATQAPAAEIVADSINPDE